MMNAGDEMVQVMKIMYQGMEYTLKLSGAFLKNAAMLIAALLQKQGEKPSVDETNLIKMLQDGEPLKVLRFDEKDLTAFCKLSKDFGFPVVPIKNRTENELNNVLVREKDAELINAALQELGYAKMHLHEHEKNANGTPPKSYLNELENSLDNRRSETLRIGEGAAIPLLEAGDERHGDFIPTYCYPPDVVYAEQRPIPLLGDGEPHKPPTDVIHAPTPFIPLLTDSNRAQRPRHRQMEMRMAGRYVPPKGFERPDGKDKSATQQKPAKIILSPAEYTVSDAELMKKQETEPIVFLQDPLTGNFEMVMSNEPAKREHSPRNREHKPSVKKELAKHAAKLKEQARKEPVKQKAAER